MKNQFAMFSFNRYILLFLSFVLLSSQNVFADDLQVTFNVSHFANGNNISCNGAHDGSIEAVIVGGTSPYTFSWSNGSYTKTINGLGVGTYTITVTDAANQTITGDVDLIEPEALTMEISVSNYSGYNVSEQGGSDGEIGAKPVGGSGDYSYAWSNGSTSNKIGSLSVGTYSVTVTDRNGCSVSASRTLTQPTPLHVTSITSPLHHGYNLTCKASRDGSIDLSVTGGVPPYTYDWSNGSFTEDISGLFAGDYVCNITDHNGVKIPANITLTEPPEMSVTVTRQQYSNGFNLSCHDCANGTATPVITGGISPFTYHWSNGQTTANATGLTAQGYAVEVMDVNGCKADGSTTLYAPDRDDWSMGGNANTDPATQFMGTTDNKDFVFKTNNQERLRIGASGILNIEGGLKVSNLGGTGLTNVVMSDGQGNVSSQKIILPACTGNLVLAWQQSPYNASDVFSCWRRFGIGTDTPDENLDVAGVIKASHYINKGDCIKIGHTGGDAFINNFGTGNLLINYTEVGGTFPVKKTLINTGAGGDVVIGNTTNHLNIISNTQIDGNLSISTPSSVSVGTGVTGLSMGPFYQMATGGNYYPLSYFGFNAKRTVSGTNPPWTISGDNYSNGGAGFVCDGIGNLRLFIVPKTSGSGPYVDQTFTDAALIERTKVVFRADGKVGIGVSPNADLSSDYNLFVLGGIRTEKIRVDVAANNWADFVFDKNYRLMPIAAIEKFVQINHHLPEVPSEEEVLRNGVDIVELQAKLLQKIEELTLYIVEQENRIKKLEMKK